MTNIEQILEELYELDPDFRQHEAKLKQIISELLANRPVAKIDEEFVKGLRAKLLAKAELINNENKLGNFNFMKKLNYILGGTAVVAVALAAVVLTQKQTGVQIVKNSQPLFGNKVEIEKVGFNAFGNLALNSGSGGDRNQSGGGNSMAIAPAPEQAPTADNGAAQPKMAYGMGGGGDMSIMPPMYTYKYVYKGEKLENLAGQMDVYRRVKGFGDQGLGGNLLQQLNFGLLDTGKFSNTTIQNLSIAEDKPEGYVINLNVQEGTIYISENWPKWPHPEANCRDEACYKQYQLKPEQIPADEKLIEIANKFLADHNISLENYGAPKVQDYWRQELARATDKSMVYIPDQMSVVYPLKIDGKEAFDEGGNATGLNVGVNVRLNKVSSVGELSALKFQASGYEVESDFQKIVDAAQNGGNYGPVYYTMPAGGEQKELTVELGTPTLSFVRMWQYNGATSDEIFVPAYIFPVTSVSGGDSYYPKNVVVPVAKEFMNRYQDGGPVKIMPLAEPAVKQ